MPTTLPASIQKYFWGDDLSELSWGKHRAYITQTVLEKGDCQAVNWLFTHCTKQQVYRELDRFQLSKKSANFWKIYLS